VAELDGSGAVVARFVYGSRPNVPDYLVKGGVTYRILSDHLGSVRLVVDASTGAVAQRIDYDEFGRVLLDTNPGFQPFGFAGGIDDRDVALVRFGARDYDAVSGRWTAKDRFGFRGWQENLYAYSAIDPINFIDRTGETTSLTISGSIATPGRVAVFGALDLDECGSLTLSFGFGLGGGAGVTAGITESVGGGSAPDVGVVAAVEGGNGVLGAGYSESLSPAGRQSSLTVGYGFGFGWYAGTFGSVPLGKPFGDDPFGPLAGQACECPE
jgi:RHS repeat-associated protein